MSRRRVVEKRKIQPDPVYDSLLLAKFINQSMKSGKKSLAERNIYKALEIIAEKKKGQKPLEVFENALNNVKPIVEVKSRRVGGATYQVPIEVKTRRAMALAMKWMVDFSRKRGEKGIILRLAGEILDAFDNKGGAFKKKEDTHRMAEANRVFAHYNW